MALQFTDCADIEVRNLIVMIYSPPNWGKTTLALTADEPVILDFDGGVHRAGNKSGKLGLQVRDWSDVADMDAESFEGRKTVIVDTVGSALTCLSEALMKENARNRAGPGHLSLQGYGALKGRFAEFLQRLVSYGLDVVLVAHGEESDKNGETVDRIEAAGGSKNLVCQKSDLIGRLSIPPERSDRRRLSFNPTATSLGKNVGLPDYELKPPEADPSPYLTEIIAEAKRLINDQSDAATAEATRLDDLKSYVDALTSDDLPAWNSLA